MERLGKRLVNTILPLLLVGSLVWGWQYLRNSDTLPIKSVKINGPYVQVPQKTLEKTVMPYVHAGFFSVDMRGLRRSLVSLPWVEEVSISRLWPDTVAIRVTEQQAVVRWGDNALLNAQGDIFRPQRQSISTALPLLRGPHGQAQEALRQYKEMNALLAKIGLKIQQASLSERHAWQLKLNNGTTVLLGRIEPKQRLARFVKAYPQLIAKRGATLKKVDLRYPNSLAVK